MSAPENNPLISIVIPVYNGERYLQQTVESLLSQIYGFFEVFFVDDGSTDDSLKIIEKYVLSDNRMKLFQKKHEGRVVKSLNYILPKLNGKFFLYMSQDDFLSPITLLSLVKRAEETGADAVLPDMCYFYGENSEKNSILSGLNGDRNVLITGRQALQYSLDWTIHGFALFKADILKRIGFADFSLNSDEYSVRVFYFNCKKVAFSEGVFYYRQHSQSITRVVRTELFEMLETNMRLYDLVKNSGYDRDVYDKVMLSNANWLIIFMDRYFKNRGKIVESDRKTIMKRFRSSFAGIDKKRLFEVKTKKHNIMSYLWMTMFFHDRFWLFFVLSFIYCKIKRV